MMAHKLKISFSVVILLIFILFTENLTHAQNCSKIGEKCSGHSKCCTRMCPPYLGRCVSNPQIVGIGNCIGVGGQCGTSYQCCSNTCDFILQRCISNDVATFVGNLGSNYLVQTPDGKECLAHGVPCTYNSQCCTKRCHSFAHRCVS